MALSANTILQAVRADDYASFAVAASAHIYVGSALGLQPTGYVRPFTLGDTFVGFSTEEVTNGTTAGAYRVKALIRGIVKLSVTATIINTGQKVYATDDNTYTVTVGSGLSRVGRLISLESSGVWLVRVNAYGESWDSTSDGDGVMNGEEFDYIWSGSTKHANVLTAGNEVFIDGWRLDAIGAGIATNGINPVANSNVTSLLLDNDNEAQNLTIESPMVFNITKGIRFDCYASLHTAGGAATDDLDIGLVSLATGIADAQRADIQATTASYLYNVFHLDTNGLDLAAASDDNTTVVAPTDTTTNLVLDTYNHFVIILRASGCEMYVDGVRQLSTTTFAPAATGLYAGIVNLEKSTGTGVPELYVKYIRVRGAS